MLGHGYYNARCYSFYGQALRESRTAHTGRLAEQNLPFELSDKGVAERYSSVNRKFNNARAGRLASLAEDLINPDAASEKARRKIRRPGLQKVAEILNRQNRRAI